MPEQEPRLRVRDAYGLLVLVVAVWALVSFVRAAALGFLPPRRRPRHQRERACVVDAAGSPYL